MEDDEEDDEEEEDPASSERVRRARGMGIRGFGKSYPFSSSSLSSAVWSAGPLVNARGGNSE